MNSKYFIHQAKKELKDTVSASLEGLCEDK